MPSKKTDALEILARLRRGEKIDTVKEEEPLFDEVNEVEYKKTRRSKFVVVDEDDEEIDDDSDEDFIDDEEEEEKINKSKSKKKSKLPNPYDPKQQSVKAFLKPSKPSGSASKAPKIAQDDAQNEDDILHQMLFDLPDEPAPKRLRVGEDRRQQPVKTKANYEPIHKPPRTISPEVKVEVFETTETVDEFVDEFVADPFEIVAEPLEVSNTDGKDYRNMYWLDCVEQPKTPGTICFIGRIQEDKRYVSCCTIVKNVTKTCYLLIKQDSTYEQAVFEFTNMFAKPLKFKNFTCKKVTKNYAFSRDAPLEADYVQIDYLPNQPPLPANLAGETFSQILNLNQSPMEKLILDLKLRGPCWLRLVDPVASESQMTWSKIELILDSPSKLLVETDCEKLQAPYFCTLSLSIRTFPNPVTHNNEIIAIGVMVNTCFKLDECLTRANKASGHFCLMTKPPASHKELRLPFDFNVAIKEYRKTKFQLFDSERDLLQEFMDRFMNLDPDIVVGHDLLNFDYETLVMRMRALNLNIWSKLGRFRRSELPQTKAAFRYMFAGRVLCDIKTSAQELIKARSYDLTQLTLQTLGRNRADYNHGSILQAYKSSPTLIQMIHSTWEDTDNIFSILAELNIIPLALKITNITGNILSRTLAAGRSERNEYLLLHAFHEANFICPEKQLSSSNRFNNKKQGGDNNDRRQQSDPSSGSTMESGETTIATAPTTTASNPLRKKAAYAGGLVLEPKAGYYDSCILLMDFNSLYPSIIQEFNICFSTVKAPDSKDLEACPDAEIISSVPGESVPTGILPAQLRNLVDRRRAVKRLLANCKSPSDKLMFDIEQKALKLTANSMYGCLGFDQSRFYAKHLASLVTFKGREILMSTKAMVEQLGFEVIYGDTDSLMINTKITDFDEVLLRGNTIKTEINSKFNLLEIGIDGVYRPLLLLKKKNYAGAMLKKLPDGTLIKEIETKGLDTVRRDRAVIAKEAGERVLDMLLNAPADKEIDLIVNDIHEYLKQLGASIAANELPGDKFVITKQLNRNPDEYRDTKGLGHVVLALRHNADSRNTRKLKAGDTVEYVICLDGSSESANQRAYTLKELASAEPPGKLQLDYEYYLCQQIHPVMVRICDKLPTTNAYVLAEMLGVEKSSLLHIRRDDCDGDAKKDQLISRGAARFNSCEAIQIKCPNCGYADQLVTRTRKNLKTKKVEFSLTSCPECSIRYAMRSKHIVFQFIQLIRKLTLEVYTSPFICDNAECGHKTRNSLAPLGQLRGQERPVCEMCDLGVVMTPEWDDRRMDLHLNYMRYLLNIERSQLSADELSMEPASDDVLDMYKECLAQIDYALKTSSINNIDTNLVFSLICSGGNSNTTTASASKGINSSSKKTGH